MKIRTPEDLVDALGRDFDWRLKEMHENWLRVQETHGRSSGAAHQAAIRAGLVMLYAHWEGFVKTAVQYYVDFLNSRRVVCADLKPNFVAILLRGRLTEAGQSRKVAVHTNVVEYLIDSLQERFQFDGERVLRTANLSSDVLEDMTHLLGVDYGPFASKENLIDEALLRRRNEIAHGQYLEVDEDRYEELHDEVIRLLREVQRQVENAVVQRLYLRATAAESAT